jgi:hypothetical protein
VNTWNDVGHKAGNEEENEGSDAISVVGVGGSNSGPATNQQHEEEGSEDNDEEAGVKFLLEEADPLFCGSNFMQVGEEEPLFFLELPAEQRAAANHLHVGFPNGNGITEVKFNLYYNFISILCECYFKPMVLR